MHQANRRYTIVLALLIASTACDRASPDAGDARSRAVSSTLSPCPAIVQASNGRRMLLDLTCAQSSDTVALIRIGYQDALVVSHGRQRDTVLFAEEAQVELLAFGDVDEDGVRDVLLVESDETSIVPLVYSLAVGDVKRIPFLLSDGTSSTALFRDLEHPEDCVSAAMPAFRLGSSGRVIVSLVLPSQPSLDCAALVRRDFEFVAGQLRIQQ